MPLPGWSWRAPRPAAETDLRQAAAALARAQQIAQQSAGEELVAAELRDALLQLGKIVGEVYTDDVLDRIFIGFASASNRALRVAMGQADRAPTSRTAIDQCLNRLTAAKPTFRHLTMPDRLALVESCRRGTKAVAGDWVAAACQAKGIDPAGPSAAEEIAAGPLATARFLLLLTDSLTQIDRRGAPALPGKAWQTATGQWCVPVFPTRAGMWDAILFRGFHAHVRLPAAASLAELLEKRATDYRQRIDQSGVCLVLGAGNVTSIAPTDALTKMFLDGRVVLLKMNPVNDYLGPILEDALAELIAAGFLQIIYGGVEVGAYAAAHPQVDELHITGSHRSHETIVWGESADERQRRRSLGTPRLTKPISSELGNVTPWIVVPGTYRAHELDFQAENVAATITNNASFNCVATKVIVTWAGWHQRQEFLDRIERVLVQVPRRKAYYPGAVARYERLTGRPADAGQPLPWTLLRDVDPVRDAHLLAEESFVCVTAETAYPAADAHQYLDRVADFVNEQCWGTLAVGVMVPPSFRCQSGREGRLERLLGRLRYGTVAVNHWPGLAFGMMGCPWGGFPGGSLDDPQSGIGWVHNTLLLDRAEQTVLEGPLVVRPKPLWFPTHRHAHRLAQRVLELYQSPSWWRLPAVMAAACEPDLGGYTCHRLGQCGADQPGVPIQNGRTTSRPRRSSARVTARRFHHARTQSSRLWLPHTMATAMANSAVINGTDQLADDMRNNRIEATAASRATTSLP